jgi:hypothetical protein
MEIENNESIQFVDWIGDKGYRKQSVYTAYKWADDAIGDDRPEPIGEYLGEFWSTEEDIDLIMVDNNNEELDWIMENSFTTAELYKKFKDETV